MEEIDELESLSTTKSFSSMVQKDPEVVMIVDALNLGYRYAHSGQLDFAEDYIKTVQSLAQSYKAGRVIITCDKGASSYRKSIYPKYKANRKEKQLGQTQEEKDKFAAFFSDFEKTIEAISAYYPVLRFEGVEADDLAAWLVANLEYKECWLISSDRDLDLLVTEKVSRFSYVTRKEVTVDNWPYECSPDSYLGYKVLQGDKGDDIDGVPGLGPKRAAQLLEQYDDIFTIMDLLPLPGKQKFIQNLNNSATTLELNLQLMDLVTYSEQAIGEENVKEIKRILNC